MTIGKNTGMGSRPRILILGGTSEASQLAAHLANRKVCVTSSLAGRVSQPALPPGPVRIGGFGGVDGLTAYLTNASIQVVIDMTHPFASRISCNAKTACTALNIPLIAFERPPWTPHKNDHWISVPDMRSAALMAETEYKRVFLTVGRQELGAFSDCRGAWFLVRCIDKPEDRLPPKSKLLLARGPFDRDTEIKLLRDESIDVIVTKNSGGPATYSKIEAARELRTPVIMIERPKKHLAETQSSLDHVLLRLEELMPRPSGQISARGDSNYEKNLPDRDWSR